MDFLIKLKISGKFLDSLTKHQFLEINNLIKNLKFSVLL